MHFRLPSYALFAKCSSIFRIDRLPPSFNVSGPSPHPNEFKAPNLDTAAGAGTRVTFGSAVVLDQPPFSISCTELSRSAAPQRDDGLQDSYTRGSIRTFLVHPK